MKRVFKNAVIAAVLTAIANAIVYKIALAMDVPLQITIGTTPTETITLMPVILNSVVPALVAAVIYIALAKWTKNPQKIFKVIAVVVFILSLAGPILGDATTSTKITLTIMHVIAALFITKGVTMRERTIPSEPLPGATM